MKLYFSTGACSLSPHIILREAGLGFSTEKVNLHKKTTAGGADYLAINPKGQVPALVLDSGAMLTEGPAIALYLADLAPEKQLAPAAGSMERYQLLEWLNYLSTEVHKSYSPMFDPGASDELKAMMRAKLARRFDYLNGVLGARDYLMGAQFSVADPYLFVLLNWTAVTQIDLAPWPALRAFQARIGLRPAVQDALRAEGLLA